MKAQGQTHIYPDNVDTDVIIPARYLNTSDPKELASHCMCDIDADFVNKVKPGDIMVAGWNFGCGSSREHAPIAIKESGISCVIAKSFARIFYRNAINIGLPILECEQASDSIQAGDEIEIDFDSGVIHNLTRNESYQAYMGMSITRLDLKTGERRSLLDEEIGAELSWGYRCVMLEDGDRSYLCMSVEIGINTGSYHMLVLDLTSEETWIADDWIAGPNSSSVMASLVDLRDGLLYAILGYEDRSSMYANYGYTVPVYGTIPWQDYLAGGEDWTYIDPWDGAANPMDAEGIAAWQSALGLG